MTSLSVDSQFYIDRAFEPPVARTSRRPSRGVHQDVTHEVPLAPFPSPVYGMLAWVLLPSSSQVRRSVSGYAIFICE